MCGIGSDEPWRLKYSSTARCADALTRGTDADCPAAGATRGGAGACPTESIVGGGLCMEETGTPPGTACSRGAGYSDTWQAAGL